MCWAISVFCQHVIFFTGVASCPRHPQGRNFVSGESSKQPAIDVGPIFVSLDSVPQVETIATFETLVLTTG